MVYSTDLTDAQWNALRGLFAPRGRPGRRARISARRKVNAILWLARTGAPWRYLPRTYGPWGAIWQQFRRWRDSGVWARAKARLVRLARQHEGRDPEPSLLMVDRGFRLLANRLAADHGLMVEIRYWDQRPEGGFKPTRPLWKVEDCFARLGAWRWLSRCFEATPAAATSWLQVASVGLLANKAKGVGRTRHLPQHLALSVR